jgi:hypothetical protein
MRNLDAACYYCFELNLPQEKRLYPAAQAAAEMWSLVLKAEGPEGREQLMADARELAASSTYGGILTHPAVKALKVSTLLTTSDPKRNFQLAAAQ